MAGITINLTETEQYQKALEAIIAIRELSHKIYFDETGTNFRCVEQIRTYCNSVLE